MVIGCLSCKKLKLTIMSYVWNLSDSEEPFLCPSCTSSNQQAAIASLQNCLKALTDEVRSLKATVASIQTQVQSAPTATGRADTGETTATRNPAHHGPGKKASNGESWTTVVKKKKGTHRQKGNKNANKTRSVNLNSNAGPPKKRIPIENARKVWGTLKSANPSAITNAIERLIPASPLAKNLSVKRKYKAAQDGSVKKWWFVIRGSVSDIRLLDQEWAKVATQTGWKLENVFCYDDIPEQPQVSPGFQFNANSAQQPSIENTASHSVDNNAEDPSHCSPCSPSSGIQPPANAQRSPFLDRQ